MAISAFNQKYLDDYEYYMQMQTRKNAIRSNTTTTYIVAVRQYLDYLSDIKCTEAELKDADQWLMSLKGRDNEGISAATHNLKIVALNSFYDRLVVRKIVPFNFFREIPLAEIERGEDGNQETREELTSVEIERLKKVLQNEVKNPTSNRRESERALKMLALRDRAIITLMIYTGMRVGEVCSLEFDQLVYKKTNSKEDVLVINIPKIKNKNPRTDRNVPPVYAEIIQYIDEYRDSLWFEPDNNYVFLSRNGKQLKSKDIYSRVLKYCETAGIDKHITPHGLRHTCASLFANTTRESQSVVAKWLGHSEQVLRTIYTHQNDDLLDRGLKF